MKVPSLPDQLGLDPELLREAEAASVPEEHLGALDVLGEEVWRRTFEDNRACMMVARASDGAIVAANDAAVRFYGRPRRALLALRIGDINLTGDEGWPRVREAVDEGGGPFVSAHRLGSGEVRPVEVTITPLSIRGERHYLGIVSDVSERVRAEARLRELNDDLERRVAEEVARSMEAERTLFHQGRLAAMGEMLGAIAHQWRQPLNALALLLGNLDDARRHQQLGEDYLARALGDGQRLVHKMASTISDFRDFFRPDKARARFALRPQIDETVGLLEASLRHHDIDVRIEGDDGLHAFGLPNEYSQVLLNLLGNARDAILERGGGGRIDIRVARDGGHSRVAVTDDGGGVAVEPIERVFEPYFTTKPSGTGLGLYLSRMILQRTMGGELEVRRVPGGSEFTMVAPLPPE